MTGSRLKGGIKAGLKHGLMWTGQVPPVTGCRILTYHSVGNRNHEMNVTASNFAEQMTWLAEHATVISLDDAATGGQGVAITFDDGFADNLYNAAPILTRYHFPATIFLVTRRMGRTLDGECDPANGRLLTWDEARELEAAGISLGGHTLTHARLSSLTPQEQQDEIEGCMKDLEVELAGRPAAFAYPYGSALDFTAEAEGMAGGAGFSYAVSNRYGVANAAKNRWGMRRVWIDRTDTLAMFQAKVDGRLDALGALDSGYGIRARRAMNRLLRTA